MVPQCSCGGSGREHPSACSCCQGAQGSVLALATNVPLLETKPPVLQSEFPVWREKTKPPQPQETQALVQHQLQG